MGYVKQEWEDSPSQDTPISASRLNHMETQYEEALTDAKNYTDDSLAAAAPGGLQKYSAARGCTLYSYGHSYTEVPNLYCTKSGGEHPLLLGSDIGASRVEARGRGGTPAPDTWGLALEKQFDTNASANRQWVPGSRGIVIHQNYMNEAPLAMGSDPKYRDMWYRAVKSLIGLWSSAKLTTPASLTKRGTWTAYGNTETRPYFPSSECVFSSTVGSEVDCPVTGDEVWVVGGASSTYALGTFEVRCNGQVVGSFSPNATNPEYTSSVRSTITSGWWSCAYRVTGLNEAAGTAGSKVVTVRVTSASPVFVGGFFDKSPNPPQIFLAKEPPRPSNASGYANFQANDPVYRSLIDTLVSEFSNVNSVDLAPGYDTSLFVSSIDPTHKHHPNDLGQRHIAERYLERFKEVLPEPVNGVIVI